jgi:Leucine-rich repeat (LRR) protein
MFENLKQLEKLRLNDNQIKSWYGISPFMSLSNLQQLWLNSNKLSSIANQGLFNALFNGLNKLIHLNLSSNNIQVFDSISFKSLINLSELILSSNNIVMLHNSPFQYLSSFNFKS